MVFKTICVQENIDFKNEMSRGMPDITKIDVIMLKQMILQK